MIGRLVLTSFCLFAAAGDDRCPFDFTVELQKPTPAADFEARLKRELKAERYVSAVVNLVAAAAGVLIGACAAQRLFGLRPPTELRADSEPEPVRLSKLTHPPFPWKRCECED